MKRVKVTQALRVTAKVVRECKGYEAEDVKAIVRERLWAENYEIDMIEFVMSMYELATAIGDLS